MVVFHFLLSLRPGLLARANVTAGGGGMVGTVHCDLVSCWSVGCTGRLVLVDTGTAMAGTRVRLLTRN